jgi:molybdopterin-containing oxidoreductase family membrane subunit
MSTPGTINRPLFFICCAAGCIGLGVWLYQLLYGLSATGVTQNAVWGLYIAAFFTAAAAGAGGLALAGLLAMNGQKQGLAGLYGAAVVCFVLGGLYIAMDIGRIGNIFAMIFSFRPASSMARDFWALGLCTIVAAAGFFLDGKGRVGAGFGLLSLLAACLLIFVEGMMLAEVPGREFWGGGTVAAFLADMATAGFALALLLERGNSRFPLFRKGFLVSLPLAALLACADLFAIFLAGGETGMYITGTFLFYLIVGVAAPFALALKAGEGLALRGAAALALIGMTGGKLWLLAAGFASPLVVMPGAFPHGLTLAETLGVVGMSGLALAICCLANASLKSPGTPAR